MEIIYGKILYIGKSSRNIADTDSSLSFNLPFRVYFVYDEKSNSISIYLSAYSIVPQQNSKFS